MVRAGEMTFRAILSVGHFGFVDPVGFLEADLVFRPLITPPFAVAHYEASRWDECHVDAVKTLDDGLPILVMRDRLNRRRRSGDAGGCRRTRCWRGSGCAGCCPHQKDTRQEKPFYVHRGEDESCSIPCGGKLCLSTPR